MPRLLEVWDFDQLYEAVVAAGRHVERHAECFFWTDEFGAWDVGPDYFVGVTLPYMAGRDAQERKEKR